MFSYRPPKGSCWGHAIRPKNPLQAKQRVNVFFEKYFERLAPEWDTTRQLTLELSWNASVLPSIQWHEDFLKSENLQWQKNIITLTGNRIAFLGFRFPLSSEESASYEFLQRFSTDAPFKMSSKHFQVGIAGKTGKLLWRKPDADIAARLAKAIG